MDIKQLRTFSLLAKERTYVTISEQTNYSVSALTDHIASLENEFNVKLVEKQGKKMILTKAGMAFLPFAEEMLRLYDSMALQMQSISEKKSLVLIVAESLGRYLMPGLYEAFMEHHPDIELSFLTSLPETFNQSLLNNKSDLAVGYIWYKKKDSRFEYVSLGRERVCFFTAAGDSLAQRKSLSYFDLGGQKFMFKRPDSVYYHMYQEICRAHHMNPAETCFMDNSEIIKKRIANTGGIGLMPYSHVREDVEHGRLELLDLDEEPIWVEIVACTLKNRADIKLQEEFFAVARHMLTNE